MNYSTKTFSAQVDETVTDVDTDLYPVVTQMVLGNTTSAPAYVQWFFKAASEVTLGTTPPDKVTPLLADGGLSLDLADGWKVPGTGLSVACTTGRTNSTGAAVDVDLWLE
jgi:hypothetical protein